LAKVADSDTILGLLFGAAGDQDHLVQVLLHSVFPFFGIRAKPLSKPHTDRLWPTLSKNRIELSIYSLYRNILHWLALCSLGHPRNGDSQMLRAALTFFVIGLIAMVLGANNVAGLSVDLGKTLLVVFLVLAILSAVTGVFFGGRATKHLP
jgi:uncharacterized membrane protein YtjA (UPF0391 family)